MKKAILAVMLSTIATGAFAENVTFHKEDTELLDRVAPLGISQANWDSNGGCQCSSLTPTV